jgi:hypothetical protein
MADSIPIKTKMKGLLQASQQKKTTSKSMRH